MRRSFSNIYVVLILMTVAALVWLGFGPALNSKYSSAQVHQQQTKNREVMNIASLNALLTADGVRVDDAALLPPQAEQSRTIFVRLQSGDNNSADGFSAQIPENIAVSLLKLKTETGALSRQRIFELSTDQILSVAVNAHKQVLWWAVQPDPMVFRAEVADDAGRLSGKTLYRQEAEMLVPLPADAGIAEVRLYRPIWDGVSSYSLELIGGLNLK